MSSQILGWLPLVLALLGAGAVIYYFSRAHRSKERGLEKRPRISSREIYDAHFLNSGIGEPEFTRLWKELSDALEIPQGVLLPSDRFSVELTPLKGLEFNDPIHDVRRMIESRCKSAGVNPTSIGTVRDYIVAFGRRAES